MNLKIPLHIWIFCWHFGILQSSTLDKASAGIKNINKVVILQSHTHVILIQNSIKHIPSCYFTDLPNLRQLEIDINQVDSIDDFAFSQLYNLQFLDLQSNKLQAVTTNMFKGLISLQRLYLNSNEIHTLAIGSFSDLTDLQQLFLHLNQLQTVQEGIFDPVSHPSDLNDFRIYSNPSVIQCNCDIAWIVEAYGDWMCFKSSSRSNMCWTSSCCKLQCLHSPA